MNSGCWLIVYLAALPGEVHAPAPVATSGPATLLAAAPVKDRVIQYDLKKPLSLSITVEGVDGLSVEMPDTITRSPGWQLLSRKPPVIEPLAAERVRWRQDFVLDALLPPGRHELQIETLRYREPPGDWSTIDWPKVAVEVSASSGPPELRDITAIERLPEARGGWPLPAGLALGALVLAAAVAVMRLLRGRAGQRHRLSATERALYELERIRALNLPAAGQMDRFHSLLSNVLRTYLQKRFGIRARQRTTTELRQEIEQIAELSSEQQHELNAFFDACDAAKFAANQPTIQECERRLTWVMASVRWT